MSIYCNILKTSGPVKVYLEERMKISHNVPLANYTSLKAGGNAETLIEIEDSDNLKQTLSDPSLGRPVWILGYGTNCLISDHGLPGSVILNRKGSLSQLSPTRFKVTSGYDWDEFIRALIIDGLWGLEFTSGIPGGVGAAIVGDIAAYGHKVADSLVEATIFDLDNEQIETWGKDKFDFSYRTSSLKLPENKNKVVLDATFELSATPTSELEYDSALKAATELGLKPDSLVNRRKIIMEARRQAGSLFLDPKVGPWTAGSFFKNPLVSEALADAIMKYEEHQISGTQIAHQNLIHGENKSRVSAAHVLLAAGFHRGQTWGQVRLHPDHILKIENVGAATAQEIYDVVQHIVETVRQKLGITLEPEVRFLGQF